MGKSGTLTVIGLCLQAFVLQSPPSAFADDASSLREMVLRDYPPALKILESRLANAKGLVRRSTEQRPKARSSVSNGTLTFECKRPYMARVIIEGETTTTKADVKTLRRGAIIACYNREYSFELSKGSANRDFSVSSLDTKQRGPSEKEGMTVFTSLTRYLNAPFSMLTYRLSELFTDERFSVRAVSRVREGDKQMLRIECDMKPDSKGRGEFRGWLVVSHDDAWVLRSFEYIYKSGIYHRGTIEYGGIQRGVPTPKRVVQTSGRSGDGDPVTRYVYDFDEISLVEVPDQDFTFTAFGFPELGRPSGRLGRSRVPWLFVLSFSAMAMAIALKTASSHIQRKRAMGGA
jgi:hypothetical protein